MNIIVTVDENWAIGNRDRQLVKIPADWRALQEQTAGGVIIMGRKTLKLMPQEQPLFNRKNIILSANPAYRVRGADTADSLDALFQKLEGIPGEDIYVCGGESVYRQLLPHCDTAYVTMVEKSYAADRYFENLDKSEEWRLTEESDEQTCFDITYYFRKYKRI
ncbi:MAG: dihydrofolate reductase [Lachnospiraceae bacterium]|nr:dihydrofolate reductase [Lachnospiraceae bacterium]MDE5801478.1 dihydrofolate reductase [Lachnospiraceae bacterium]